MREITSIDTIRKIELKLLESVAKICDANHLRYWLTAGTLLGAVRHKGFIPWDDDIDIMMPRSDYNKLIKICSGAKNDFILYSHENNPNYYRLFAKVCSNDTLIHDFESEMKGCDIGVWIDIFPLDGLGDDLKKANSIFKKTAFNRYLLVSSIWKKYFKSKSRHWYIEPIRFVFYLFGKLINKKRTINKIEHAYINIDFDKSKYCGCVCGSYGVMERAWFNETVEIEFEGELFKTIKCYDAYLTYLYGDYMKLPPANKRNSAHSFKAYWRQ